jgi:hypothetical protein
MSALGTRFVVAGLLGAAALAAVDAQQRDQLPRVMLPIVVVDGETRRPIDHPVIFVAAGATGTDPSSAQRSAIIGDTDGRAVARQIPVGPVEVAAVAPGYLRGEYGARWPGDDGIPVQVGLDMASGPVELRLWRAGTITGRVVDARGNPMADVRVGAFSRESWPEERYVGAAESFTDSDGAYRLSSLEPGDYLVAATFPRRAVPISAWTAFSEAQTASPQEQADFARRWIASGAPTADVAGVSRGDRLVAPDTPGAVITAADRIRVAATTFYPGVVVPEHAATIQLDSGSVISGVDVTIAHSEGVAVTGFLMAPDGPAAHAGIRLLRQGFSAFARQDAVVTVEGVTDAEGRFVFDAVAPGTYDLWAFVLGAESQPGRSTISVGTRSGVQPLPAGRPQINAPPAESATLVGQLSLSVGPGEGGPVEVLVPLRPAVSVSGAASFGTGSDPEPGPLTVRLTRVRGLTAGLPFGRRSDPYVTIDGPGPFAVHGVLPGDYRVGVETEDGVPLQPMPSSRDSSRQTSGVLVVGAQDLTGVDIAVSTRSARLLGAVSGASDEPWKTSVVVFPIDQALRSDVRRTVIARVSMDGRYVVQGLPPGQYFVAATEQALPPHRLPTALERLVPAALRVTIGTGDQIVNLSVREIP